MLTAAILAAAATWSTSHRVDPVDGTVRTAAVLRERGDALFVQCDVSGADRQLIVAIRPAKYVGFPDSGPIEYRFNNQPAPAQQEWEKLKQLVGTLQQSQGLAFVYGMAGAQSVAIKLYDWEKFPTTVVFELPEDRGAVDMVLDLCQLPRTGGSGR